MGDAFVGGGGRELREGYVGGTLRFWVVMERFERHGKNSRGRRGVFFVLKLLFSRYVRRDEIELDGTRLMKSRQVKA